MPDLQAHGRRVALVLAAALLALSAPRLAGAQEHLEPARELPVADRYAAAIDSARELLRVFMREEGTPGLSIAVGAEGRLVWSEGMGFADVEHRVPVTPLTKFRTGSIAKTFTGTALALLVQRDRLDLDRPVREYVPSWPKKRWTITPRQLAGHLAGVRHYPPEGDEFFNQKRYTTTVEAMEYYRQDSLLFEPGTEYSYSSYGYNLLGAVIRNAADRHYLRFMDENVFEPLGMRHTVGDHSDSLIAHRTGYYERSGAPPSYHTRQSGWNDPDPTLLNAPFADNSYKWPSGGFLTTPEDLVRYASALNRPGFLEAETLDLLYEPMETRSGEATGYALGWRIGRDARGYRTRGHGGGSVGGTSRLLVYPEQGVVVAVQANLTDVEYGDLPQRIAWLFLE